MSELVYVKPTRRKKPGPTAKYRAKRARAEGPIKKAVRETCVDRDGYCRYWADVFQSCFVAVDCSGPSEWAHLENQKRARTRGMKPGQRHTTAGTAMLCRCHHRAYDAGELKVEAHSDKGADGPLSWRTE
jgi:hypothetical protein